MSDYRLLTVIQLPDRATQAKCPAMAAKVVKCLQCRATKLGVTSELGVCQHCGRAALTNVLLRAEDGSVIAVGRGCAQKLGVHVSARRRGRRKQKF